MRFIMQLQIVMSKPLLGTTYSSPHAEYLGLSQRAFDDLLDLHFNYIRIGTYWDRIEKKEGVYDFSEVKKLIEKSESAHQKVILTVGMKGPRWPEFHIPLWVKRKSEEELTIATMQYLEKSIKEFKNYSCISHWQVENEPLGPSGPHNRKISLDVLKQEVELVQSLDNRPVISTIWGNELSSRGFLPKISKISDIIGIDLYYDQFIKNPFKRHSYSPPKDSQEKLKKIFSTLEKPIWITELQAEPWEASMNVYKSNNPPSMNAEKLLRNYKYALELNPEAILFWGYEYWYYKKMSGDMRMWETIQGIINH